MPESGLQFADALSAARFSITIDGYEIASFAELAGITTEVKPEDFLEAPNQEVFVKRIPGTRIPPTITLRRGMSRNTELWAWHETVIKGDIAAARKGASLSMFNAEGKPVARFWLENAWPSKIEIAGLKAGATEVLTETVTITCEDLQRVAP
ncbi:MAG TPA: phage tail protein [Actinomycetes bacterium]|nr:phage tail protein [Actinomycetes bacterium]